MNTQPDKQLADTARSRLLGVIFLFGAGVFWSLNGVFIKGINAGGEGPDGLTIAFYRSLFAGLVLLPVAWRGFRTLRPKASKLPVRPAAILCCASFTVMTVCFVLANIATETANAIILQYTSTFWVFLLSPLILGEKPELADVWILVVAMVGIGIIFAGNASSDLLGLMLGLSSGFFFALLTVLIRQMGDSNSAAVTTFNNLGSAALLLVPVILFGNLFITQRDLLLVALMGGIQFGLPYYLYTLGLARVPAHQACLITLIEPVLAPLWVYLVLGETVTMPTKVGFAAILLAIVLLVLRNRPRNRQPIPVTEPSS